MIIFSSDNDFIEYIKSSIAENDVSIAYDTDDLLKYLKDNRDDIVFIDYDSVSKEFNDLIQNNKIPKCSVVLERNPIINVGKYLIKMGIKAYGNSKMRELHLSQVVHSVNSNKVWMYPELSESIIKDSKYNSDELQNAELYGRVTAKEKGIIKLVLSGMNNSAIAKILNISERTVKAHLSSIYSKLHVNDRLSLVLLFK